MGSQVSSVPPAPLVFLSRHPLHRAPRTCPSSTMAAGAPAIASVFQAGNKLDEVLFVCFVSSPNLTLRYPSCKGGWERGSFIAVHSFPG